MWDSGCEIRDVGFGRCDSGGVIRDSGGGIRDLGRLILKGKLLRSAFINLYLTAHIHYLNNQQQTSKTKNQAPRTQQPIPKHLASNIPHQISPN